MLQLVRGVAHLHDNWIIHRDLKTSNLLLSHKGILKVSQGSLNSKGQAGVTTLKGQPGVAELSGSVKMQRTRKVSEVSLHIHGNYRVRVTAFAEWYIRFVG